MHDSLCLGEDYLKMFLEREHKTTNIARPQIVCLYIEALFGSGESENTEMMTTTVKLLSIKSEHKMHHRSDFFMKCYENLFDNVGLLDHCPENPKCHRHSGT